MTTAQPQTSDESLIAEYIKGNKSSFNVLVARHQADLLRLLRSYTKDLDVAKDLLQETYIKALAAIDRGAYSECKKFYPWLCVIALNVFKDYYRRKSANGKKGQLSLESVLFALSESDNEKSLLSLCDNSLDDAQERELQFLNLEKCIANLKPQQREVVRRRLVDEPFKQIAQEMGCSLNTSLGQMHYAILNLRQMFKALVA